jgi:hypothetical protein
MGPIAVRTAATSSCLRLSGGTFAATSHTPVGGQRVGEYEARTEQLCGRRGYGADVEHTLFRFVGKEDMEQMWNTHSSVLWEKRIRSRRGTHLP